MTTPNEKTGCCGRNVCDGNVDAIGFGWLSAGRGMLVMSNFYMGSSLLWLASDAAGCFDDEGNSITEGACENKVYGFTPSSLVSNIAVIAGLLAAFLMPICGAIVDYTDYRRATGIAVIVVMVAIQGVQIYTVESTWFAMAMLQAVAGFFYELQMVVTYAYMIEIAVAFGERKMIEYTANMTSLQFACQSLFLVIMVAISFMLDPFRKTVVTAQISQSLNTIVSIILFGIAWIKYLTPRKAVNELPEGRSVLTEGFRQNWKTAKTINQNFKKGLRWFFYTLVFAEAAAQAVTTVSIIYLNDILKLDSTQVGIFFLVTLLSIIPGTKLALWVTRKSNPHTSWKLSMLFVYVVIAIGVLVLEYVPQNYCYIWGAFVGIALGWFYPTENLFFSMCVPTGQEAELSGFYVYCTQILSWLPPLVFTLCIESGVQQKYAAIVVDCFFLVAFGLLCFTASWEEIVAEAASKGASKTVKEPLDGTDDEPTRV
jgi:MFS-type transporter involved in bile tolerance (Atg22 family)